MKRIEKSAVGRREYVGRGRKKKGISKNWKRFIIARSGRKSENREFNTEWGPHKTIFPKT